MSHLSSRSHSSSKFEGLPLLSAIGIIIAALITGFLISWNAQELGWPMMWIFAIACVAVTFLVNPKGLYLTVVSIPILFAIFVLLTGWFVTRSQQAEGADPFSTTALIMAAFPLAQFFPALITVVIACLVISVVRIALLKKFNDKSEEIAITRRQQVAEEDRRNRRTTQEARSRSSQVTVQELLERNKARQGRDHGSYRRSSESSGRPVDRL
ncbi:MFS transporter [Corynebacterium breve]|uniref:MFS transporter n=1 Tax=Corynebacterium breve TaxID=3049799 RepID=A0ABY8VG96_9CORY|nr:DUF6542 domain-containing protein [Corynebacterium breve]WIM68519.1 MFS transporter [Corynebacterium breve]